MNDEHRWIREQLGAYALGVADESQRAAIHAHLAGCLTCQAELAHLNSVARKVAALHDAPARPRQAAPPQRAEQLFARVAAERRQRRRRSVTSAVMAAAAVVAILAVLVVNPFAPDPGRTVEFAVVPEGVTAVARVQDWGWGSQVHLEIAGLTDDEALSVWMERPDGSRVPAGSFMTTGGDLTMSMGASTPSADAVALGVSNAAGETLLRAPLEQQPT